MSSAGTSPDDVTRAINATKARRRRYVLALQRAHDKNADPRPFYMRVSPGVEGVELPRMGPRKHRVKRRVERV